MRPGGALGVGQDGPSAWAQGVLNEIEDRLDEAQFVEHVRGQDEVEGSGWKGRGAPVHGREPGRGEAVTFGVDPGVPPGVAQGLGDVVQSEDPRAERGGDHGDEAQAAAQVDDRKGRHSLGVVPTPVGQEQAGGPELDPVGQTLVLVQVVQRGPEGLQIALAIDEPRLAGGGYLQAFEAGCFGRCADHNMNYPLRGMIAAIAGNMKSKSAKEDKSQVILT